MGTFIQISPIAVFNNGVAQLTMGLSISISYVVLFNNTILSSRLYHGVIAITPKTKFVESS
jgi:hypothetical protein